MSDIKEKVTNILVNITTNPSVNLTKDELLVLVPYMIELAKKEGVSYYNSLTKLAGTDTLTELTHFMIKGIFDKSTDIIKIFDSILSDIILSSFKESCNKMIEEDLNEAIKMID